MQPGASPLPLPELLPSITLGQATTPKEGTGDDLRLETHVGTAGNQYELLTVILPTVHSSMTVRVKSRCDQDLWKKIKGTRSQSKENLSELLGTGQK